MRHDLPWKQNVVFQRENRSQRKDHWAAMDSLLHNKSVRLVTANHSEGVGIHYSENTLITHLLCSTYEGQFVSGACA